LLNVGHATPSGKLGNCGDASSVGTEDGNNSISYGYTNDGSKFKRRGGV